MKFKIIISFLILILLISGCQDKLVCEKPYIQVGNECCLDQNDNSICDKDEGSQTSSTSEKASGDDAEKTAIKFADTWEREKNGELYEFFTSELKSQKTKEEFIRILNAFPLDDASVRLDKVENLGDDRALAYFNIGHSALFKEELPSFEMKLIDGTWKFNAFGKIFGAECLYNYDCEYSKECKKEFESKDVSQFYYNLCDEDFNCICKGGEFETFANMCGTNYGDDEQQKDNEIRCKNLQDSQKKIEIKYIPVNDKSFKIKNSESKTLTDVVITVNKKYRKDIGTLNAQEEQIIEKNNLISDDGAIMKEMMDVDSIYVYSYEGKYIQGIDWTNLGMAI